MGMIRRFSKSVNKVAGNAAHSGVNMLSKAISRKNEKLGDYIEDVGNTVIEVSKSAIDSVGQFADGTIQGTYGLIKQDDHHKEQGLADIKDATKRTAKGISSGMTHTAKCVEISVNGIKHKDKDLVKQGLRNLRKISTVSTEAINVVDVLDEPSKVEDSKE